MIIEKYKYYITRDKCKHLNLWFNKPVKGIKSRWMGFGFIGMLPITEFPEIKWEDEEPTEVEITIKRK